MFNDIFNSGLFLAEGFGDASVIDDGVGIASRHSRLVEFNEKPFVWGAFRTGHFLFNLAPWGVSSMTYPLAWIASRISSLTAHFFSLRAVSLLSKNWRRSAGISSSFFSKGRTPRTWSQRAKSSRAERASWA